ncbi:MAG: Periplasmic dipeptide transport protein precursor [Bacteroidetes bacterium ADurb.Bin408]|nr:MAG: Periplasmic dipeptide transport protein precursor [Bacteroidetes bacterium ADurb.Bin408]
MLTMQYCAVVPHEITTCYGKDFRKNPIGTGPFYFKMWKEGIKLVLLKNTDYFETDTAGQKLPYLDAVAITFVIDKQTAFLEFVKGNIDFLSGLDASYKDELLTRRGQLNPKYSTQFNMSRCPYLNTEYLGFLVDKEKTGAGNPLTDKRIRQAINYGFDRSKMMRYLRNSIGIPGTSGIIPPGLPTIDTTRLNAYCYAPDKARALLVEAGYPGGKGLPPITLSTNPSYTDIAQHIQSDLADIGFVIKLNIADPGTLREQISKSQTDFFRGSWIADYPDAENYLSLFYSKNFCPAGPNYTHYSNPAFDVLYEKSLRELNDTIRWQFYRKMDSIMINDAPVVVLYYDEVLRFTQKNITGLGINPLNLLTLKYVKKL